MEVQLFNLYMWIKFDFNTEFTLASNILVT